MEGSDRNKMSDKLDEIAIRDLKKNLPIVFSNRTKKERHLLSVAWQLGYVEGESAVINDINETLKGLGK